MKIIKPSVENWGRCSIDVESNLARIEAAGRLCYKSEDKIGPGTAQKFVKKLYDAGHWAMIEHSNFVIRAQNPAPSFAGFYAAIFLARNKYLNFWTSPGGNVLYIGGNLTAWLHAWNQHNLIAELVPFFQQYGEFFGLEATRESLPPFDTMFQAVTEFPEELERYTFKFICDRGVSHEMVRHRPCSFAQESTRYCNYSDKDMEFIEPWWWNGVGMDTVEGIQMRQEFLASCDYSQDRYEAMIHLEAAPQAARAILPNALKTEIVVTADRAEWRHIHKLRSHKSAHPDFQRVMKLWESVGGRGLL